MIYAVMRYIFEKKKIARFSIINYYCSLFPMRCEKGVTQENYGDELVASLTSYGKRFDKLHIVIESIMRQTVKPNRLILWLAEDEIKYEDVPARIKAFESRGLEIRFCPDYKSYKKIVPSICLCPQADIITFDDDIIYPSNVIEKLMEGHRKYPDSVIACRAHMIVTENDGNISPYVRWKWCVKSAPSMKVFPTTGAGAYFPKNSFHKDFVRSDLFMQLAPAADDLWCKFLTLINRVRACTVEIEWTDFVELQKDGLWISNGMQGGNDRQLRAILNRYPQINELLSEY